MSIYHQQAAMFAAQYESVSAEQVHQPWLHLLPTTPGLPSGYVPHALDVGAGSGRDARFLAAKGFQVVAVEPADALRQLAIELAMELAMALSAQPQHAHAKTIQFLADELPALPQVQALNQQFELVLVSAVWMHLTHAERAAALPTLCKLLVSQGLLVLTLRHGSFSDGREAYPVSSAEIEALISQQQLPLTSVLVTERVQDALGRDDVAWQTVVLKKG